MRRIVLLGTGNVARHLYDAIEDSDTNEIIQVVGRSASGLQYFQKKTETTQNFQHLPDADIYILAVSDGAIGELSALLKNKRGLVLHTSGSTSIEVMPATVRRGVLYPLQTFSMDVTVEFSKVPICLEAENEVDYKLLEEFAAELSGEVYRVNSDQRRQLHIGAVYVNNFVNHLYHIGHSICAEQELPFDLLRPLIRETVRKIEEIKPFDAQTGPARRQDQTTIDLHINQVSDQARKEIYTAISNSIRATYGKKL